ncbi:hypothetical protein F7725_008751 [Dissostichus mawsoni]|uniref:Uncharacterized protein n=1 Tax=Dissostichus mawsoni TaxID=36200 RepID=A0A7J5YB80_DISMA|nr:hypothetical protein F7725_008751 [Dissostichus mawsoni]
MLCYREGLVVQMLCYREGLVVQMLCYREGLVVQMLCYREGLVVVLQGLPVPPRVQGQQLFLLRSMFSSQSSRPWLISIHLTLHERPLQASPPLLQRPPSRSQLLFMSFSRAVSSRLSSLSGCRNSELHRFTDRTMALRLSSSSAPPSQLHTFSRSEVSCCSCCWLCFLRSCRLAPAPPSSSSFSSQPIFLTSPAQIVVVVPLQRDGVHAGRCVSAGPLSSLSSLSSQLSRAPPGGREGRQQAVPQTLAAPPRTPGHIARLIQIQLPVRERDLGVVVPSCTETQI